MSEPSPRPRKNNYWIWYFAFLLIASVGVTVLMIWFNKSIQLTPEKLEVNHQRWKDKGPRDYNLIYTKQINNDPKVEKFAVKVRGGNVEEALLNGMPLDKEARLYHSMDRIFSDIDRFMNIDTKPGARKVYVTAIFDEESTGAVRRYIRRVMGSTERVEIQVRLETPKK